MHIYVTKIGVLGDMTPEMGCNINKLPKMHTLCRVDIRQSIYPQNWFTGAICDVTKTTKKTKKRLHMFSGKMGTCGDYNVFGSYKFQVL